MALLNFKIINRGYTRNTVLVRCTLLWYFSREVGIRAQTSIT